MDKLKPCPFCGDSAIIISIPGLHTKPTYFASCSGCGAEMPRVARTREQAAEVWNKRTEPERPKGRWIPTGLSNSTGPIVRCSACGQYINPSGAAIDLNRQKLEPSFCEKCGADMRGESE